MPAPPSHLLLGDLAAGLPPPPPPPSVDAEPHAAADLPAKVNEVVQASQLGVEDWGGDGALRAPVLVLVLVLG